MMLTSVMAFTLRERCLTFLKAVVKSLLNLAAPLGYQDDTGFHPVKMVEKIEPRQP